MTTRRRKSAFVGIDVACAKTKRIPIVVCEWENGRLIPKDLKRFSFKPPKGIGNVAACDPAECASFAAQVVDYLHQIEEAVGVCIQRVALDAPSAWAKNGKRRESEEGLDEPGIIYFTTPSDKDFRDICDKVREHLDSGGSHSNLPNANRLWMLVGFALFNKLRDVAECIETYPQAIVRQLGVGKNHKSKNGAVEKQFAAIAVHTGWPTSQTDKAVINRIGWGSQDDRLDAYLAAWVASLPESKREAIGTPPNDAIWIPKDVGPDEQDGNGGENNGLEPPEDGPEPPEDGPGSRIPGSRECPAPGCSMRYKKFAMGWDAHAAHTCEGLTSVGPEARKKEYKQRFGYLFKGR